MGDAWIAVHPGIRIPQLPIEVIGNGPIGAGGIQADRVVASSELTQIGGIFRPDLTDGEQGAEIRRGKRTPDGIGISGKGDSAPTVCPPNGDVCIEFVDVSTGDGDGKGILEGAGEPTVCLEVRVLVVSPYATADGGRFSIQ